jgi:mono/diheme cytochrome c family protein
MVVGRRKREPVRVVMDARPGILYGIGVRIPLGWSRVRGYRARWSLVSLLGVEAAGGAAVASPLVAQARATSTPTFSREVAPVLYRQCAACHRPEGPAPFSVLRYEEARPWAAAILASTEARRMPPWLPEPGIARFIGERRLSGEELRLIRRWVEAGAPEGDPADLPSPPEFPSGWQLGQPDLVVTLPPFTAPAEARDRYRNLVAPIPVADLRYVRAVELRPGDAHVVHHATMLLDTTETSRRLDAEDPEPGFDGMDLHRTAFHPPGFFVGWTPGRVAAPGADSLAWPLQPGTDVVLQVHLPPRQVPRVITPQIGFHFASAPRRPSPVVIMLSAREIDIPAGSAGYTVSDGYLLPVDVDVLSVYPHAHYLGKELEGYARLPGGRVRWLIRIKDWDFNWQDEYRLAEAVFIPRGSMLTMRWRYDNAAANPRNPNRPPLRVQYGPRSVDEMGDLAFQVLPRTVEDAEALERDVRWKYLADRAQWMSRWAYRQGLDLAARGRYAEAVERYREALLSKPTTDVHVALADALLGQGDTAAAVLHLGQAARLAQNAGQTALVTELRQRLRRLRH